ncbi:MAG TPA: FISUMP domain-containing protein [Bacteroidales bacterium]|nr:FISUMP domain-containing protein [Bacteroidales bacterium]HQH23722.1 FISUMP domain-containing protein [Bacteroidales bacterium]HQJ82273.1 FISUMP domain-containing protein [Bacteroidales bacterium]
MKKLIIILIMAFAISGFSQAPQKLSYQAVIRNTDNTLVTNQIIGMRISILKGSASGTSVYMETHTPRSNANGLAVVEIGGGTVISGTFSSIDWSAGPYYLKTETDPAGGTNYSISGTSQLLSVPYALYSGKAENAATKEDMDRLRQRMINIEELYYGQLPPPSEGLKAFYPFRGNTNDFSGNGWDGTVHGATLTSDRFGKADNAYHFTGTTNITTQYPGVSGNGDRSISFWVRIPAGEAGGSTCFYGSTSNGAFFNPGVFAQAAPHVHLDISNAYLDCAAPNAADGKWHHFVFVFSATLGTTLNGVRVYYDGNLLTGYTGNNFNTYTINTGTATKFTIGGKTGATSQMSIDDLRFYDRVLDDSEIMLLFYESESGGTAFVNDSDGNSYKVVKIGDQVWMAENLRTTRYNDGTAIPLVTDPTDFINLTTPAYCWSNNDIGNKPVYGALYVWYTVKTGILCPSGWHVPTDAEWTILENHLGGIAVAGGKMKETGTEHWLAPNTDATNESEFNARPGGWRDGLSGGFLPPGQVSMWWTSQETYPDRPYWRELYYNSGTIFPKSGGDPSYAMSIRCVKD